VPSVRLMELTPLMQVPPAPQSASKAQLWLQ
jgi:hypothetical protein